MAMTWEDYLEDTRDNAIDFINEAKEGAEGGLRALGSFQSIFDEMMNDDSVTGNGSGSYTYDRSKAEENIANLATDIDFREVLARSGEELPVEAEHIDVLARMLALEELYGDLEAEFNDVDDEELIDEEEMED